jgi:choline dehydrogenase-like flavoprotein
MISSTSPAIFPTVDFGWDQGTLDKQVLGIKWYRQLVFNTSFGSKFDMVELEPGLGVQTDADLRTYASKYLQPVNHQSCTTRMALSENDGVVDTNFKVFGVNKLRVASQSVLRYVPGAGGQAWCITIAHNLVNKIFSELGLPQI